MTKGGLLPKGFERPTVSAPPSDSGVQEKYEEVFTTLEETNRIKQILK